MSFLLMIVLMATVMFTTTDGELIERTKDNQMGLKRPIIITFYDFNSEFTLKMSNYWRNRLQTVSDLHKDLLFTISDADEFGEQLNNYGFEFDWRRRLESEPIIIAEDANEVRYLFDLNSKVNADSLQMFVKQFKTSELIPFIKSEPIPDNTGKAVIEVVGKTFKELVLDNKNDVFIVLYAYWCGHCKQLMPIWEQLGQRMVDEPNVDILQIDVTKNESPKPYKTLSYPTIYWLPSNDKQNPQKYSGKRNLNRLLVYVSQKATKPLIKFDRNGKRREKNEL